MSKQERKQRKREFRFFTVPEWEKEEAYLRQRHRQGWKLTKITGLCLYHFQRCQPEDVIYQLDYNKDSEIHPKEYQQLFRDCGWEYIQNYVGYSYFRKPVSQMKGEVEEIFCDDASRLEMMGRVFRGRMLVLVMVFFCCLLPSLISALEHQEVPILLFFGVAAAVYLGLFAKFAWNWWKVCRRLEPK